MGLDLTVPLPGPVPAWDRLADAASALGVPVQLRLIDGLPAFPDETPAEDWGQLGVSTPAGMVTLRRIPGGVQLVVWGNADPPLLAARDALGEAVRAAAG
jgi:hypothetical protein